MAVSAPTPSTRPQRFARAHRFLKDLEHWFDDRNFIATDAFTVADILMALVLNELKDEQIMAPYAHVMAYATGAWRALHGNGYWRGITHVSSATDCQSIVRIGCASATVSVDQD
jgi:glutathione S-transferase